MLTEGVDLSDNSGYSVQTISVHPGLDGNQTFMVSSVSDGREEGIRSRYLALEISDFLSLSMPFLH